MRVYESPIMHEYLCENLSGTTIALRCCSKALHASWCRTCPKDPGVYVPNIVGPKATDVCPLQRRFGNESGVPPQTLMRIHELPEEACMKITHEGKILMMPSKYTNKAALQWSQPVYVRASPTHTRIPLKMVNPARKNEHGATICSGQGLDFIMYDYGIDRSSAIRQKTGTISRNLIAIGLSIGFQERNTREIRELTMRRRTLSMNFHALDLRHGPIDPDWISDTERAMHAISDCGFRLHRYKNSEWEPLEVDIPYVATYNAATFAYPLSSDE